MYLELVETVEANFQDAKHWEEDYNSVEKYCHIFIRNLLNIHNSNCG